MSLYPTKTRLALLRAVDNGQVLTDFRADDFVAVLFPDAPTTWQNQLTVTARVTEAEMQGWIEERGSTGDWRLTDAGRTVLGAGAP